MAPDKYRPFIDWLKAVGITLIVVGHVAATPFDALTPPVYVKQLGVVCFIFVLGYSLARNADSRARTVFNRLFEMYFFGLTAALIMSALTFALIGDIAESNYLPFFAGINVVFDNFPANPTTWYIGTYTHVLVLWAIILYRIRVTPLLIVLCAIVEIAIRAALVPTAGNFVAYMLFTNWMTPFLLGTWHAQHQESRSRSALAVAALAGLTIIWPIVVGGAVVNRGFPFMRLSAGMPAIDLLFTSACITLLYSTFGWLIYRATQNAHAPAAIRFIARNTMFIFIWHMPVYYAIVPLMVGWPFALQAVVRLVVCLIGVALVSEQIRLWLRPQQLRDALAERLWPAPAMSVQKI